MKLSAMGLKKRQRSLQITHILYMTLIKGTSANLEVDQACSTAFNYTGPLVVPVHFDTFKLTHSGKPAVKVIMSYVKNTSS